MDLLDFHIGLEFWAWDNRYRCTDVGTRVVVAIRVDSVRVASLNIETRETNERVVDGAEAQSRGIFNGPPYGVIEIVFDEDELEQCSLTPEGDG